MKYELSDKQVSKRSYLESWVRSKDYDCLDSAIETFYKGQTLASKRHRKPRNKAQFFKNILSSPRTLGIEDELLAHDIFCSSRFNFLRGARSGLDYGFDLISSWIVEDVLVELAHQRLGPNKLVLSGDDSERHFETMPKAGADFKCGQVDVELFADFNGYWISSGHIDLKPGKWNRLSNNRYYLLCLDIKADRCLTIESVDQVEEWCGSAPQLSYNPRMSKKTYSVVRPRSGWKKAETIYGLRELSKVNR